MIHVVTDSAANFAPGVQERYGIRVIPHNVHFGTETFLEGVTIDRRLFYRKVQESTVFPTTSQPSPGQFVDFYRQFAQPRDRVLSIHCTGRLSGTCQSARLAAEELAGEIEVEVFDSLWASAIEGWMAREAAEMLVAGRSLNEVRERLQFVREAAFIGLTLETLEYARRSGRINALAGVVATLLNVKPVILMEDGVLDVRERIRTRRRALERILELAQEQFGNKPVNVAVVHGDAPEDAQKFLEQVTRTLNCREAYLDDIGVAVAVQLGPGAIGLVLHQIGP